MNQVILFSAVSAYKFIYLYAQNITRVSPSWALCFIFGAMLLFCCIFCYFKIAFKDDSKSIIVALIVMFALSLNITNLKAVPFVVAGLFIFCYFILTRLDCEKIIAFLKPFGITLLVLSVMNGANILIKTNFKIINAIENKEFEGLKTPKRNIYIILLDAHAGKRTLKHIGGDNSDFIGKLKQKGFLVYEDMESNYNKTVASIPSFLNACYIKNLSYNTPSDAVNNARLFKLAKNTGYKIYYLNSWPMDIHIVEDLIDDSYSLKENIFQNAAKLFIGKTVWYNLLDFNSIDEDKNMQNVFEYADSIFKKNGTKHLFFAHFLMPHMPYVYDEEGNINPYSKMHDTKIGKMTILDKETYLEYLKFTDDKVIEFLDEIFAKKGEKPIIIIMGDHGARLVDYYPDEDKHIEKAEKYFKYYFNTFLAYYNPDMKPENYLNTKSLINFSINFQNEVFDAGIGNVEDIQYYLAEPASLFDTLKSFRAEY